MKKLCKRCKVEFEPPKNGSYCRECADTYCEWNAEAIAEQAARRAEYKPPKYRGRDARENTYETKFGG